MSDPDEWNDGPDFCPECAHPQVDVEIDGKDEPWYVCNKCGADLCPVDPPQEGDCP